MVFFTVKSGARLGALLGIVCLGLAAVGCGSSSSSTPSASHPAAKPSGTANVACAASLLYLNEKIVAPAFQGATGLKYSGRAGPSTGLQQEIASGEISPNVFEAGLLARGKLPFPRIWEAGILCTLPLPPLVIRLLLIFLVGPYTPIGEWLGTLHLSAANTFLALVIAQVYESAPYYVLGALAAFSGVDPRMEQQAALLGDRPWRVVRRVTLPLAAPGLAMALSVAWARAMGAFGAVIIIAYHPYGLPLRIWVTLQETGLASALPFALVLIVVALPLPLAAYIWSARAQRRRQA